MASLIKRPNKHFWIQFRIPGERRQTIRLGAVSPESALETKLRIQRLVACKTTGDPPDPATTAWVKGLGVSLREKLSSYGLIQEATSISLGRLIKEFQASLAVKPATRDNIGFACDNLTAFLNEGSPIDTITEADAKNFRTWLLEQGGAKGRPLAPTTVSRRCRRAKQVFQYALDKRWLAKSPFAVLRGGNEVNRERDFFVAPDLIKAVLAETPKADMKAIISLVRYGALRCPSEVLTLKWDQVNWDKETIVVKSPKTAHHEGGASRTLPLFPELSEALEPLWVEACEGEPLLFPRRQVTGSALTNELRRSCWAAGYALWPKPWVNMRATRETELLQEFPVHVVAAWLGHSPNVAIKHYAQVVKEHQTKAVNLRQTVLHAKEGEAKSEARNGNLDISGILPHTPKVPKTR